MKTTKAFFKAKKAITNNRGSAMVFALVTMTVLILLGMAIVVLSSGTLNVNKTDAQNNSSYYGGEAGVNSAIAQLKYEVMHYYNDMLESSGSGYTALYNGFFTAINSNAQQNFIEPEIDGVTTVTTFSNGTYDAAQDIGQFLVSCTATAADGSSYVVNGALLVKRVDVSGGSSNDWIIGDAAIKAGDTLSLGKKNGVGVTGGDIIVSALEHNRKWGLPYSISGGELIIDENVADTIEDNLFYPSYSDPVITEVDVYVTENEYTFNWANVPEAPVHIVTAEGINIHFASCTVPEGTVHGKGNMHINNGTFYADFYCDGDMHINNCSVYGNVYCRGDLHLNNAVMYGNVMCDGFFEMNNAGSINKWAASGGGIEIHNATCNGSLYSASDIVISQTGVNGGIVYSSTKLTAGNLSANAVFFSGGDIELSHSLSVTGCVIAKQNIYFSTDSNKYMTVSYSQTTIDGLVYDENNAFFFSGTGEPELNENVFAGESISAVGRTS